MNVHVIIGEDDFVVGETAKKIVGDGTGLEVVDSANSTNVDLQLADLRRAEESLDTPPFLDPRKVTWWKNVAFLPGGRSSEDVKTALERFAAKLAAAKLPENQHFILSGPHLLKTSIFAKRLAGAAEIVSFAAEKPWDAKRSAAMRATEYASAQKLAFAPDAAEMFVSIVGTDARSLMSEVGKMRDYLGPGASVITSADVVAIASPGSKVETEIWAVTDAIGQRRASAALAALGRFEREDGFAIMMSGVIEKFFRQLLDVKRGNTEGLAPFAVRKNQGFAAKWSEAELRRARARFLSLREKVVSGTNAGDVLVVTELLRTIAGV